MTNEAWVKAIGRLVLAFPARDLSSDQQRARGDLYREQLADLTDEQISRAVDTAIKGEKFFPSIAALREYGLAGTKAPTGTQAQVAYDAILGCYEDGMQVSVLWIKRELGIAAMHAFMSAGGPTKFAWCEPRDEPFRRKAFVDEYERYTHDDPTAGVPIAVMANALGEGAPERPQLPAGPAPESRGLTHEESVAILNGSRARSFLPNPTGEVLPIERVVSSTLGFKPFAARPKPESLKDELARARDAEKNAKPIAVTDERLAELDQQKAAILAGDNGKL